MLVLELGSLYTILNSLFEFENLKNNILSQS